MGIIQKSKASDALVVEAQQIFRINQRAVNNGDIFRVNQSVRSIVVGSESDFSEYTLYYYDPLRDLKVNVASITVDQPWIGRIDARLTDLFPGTKCEGALYITPKNLYLPSRFQEAQQGATAFVQVWAPNIDVICYADDPSAIPDKRPLRRISTALQIEGGKNNYLYLPSYGRKSWTLRLIRADNGSTSGNFGVKPIKFVLPDLRTDETWGSAGPWVGSFANEGEIAGGTFNSEDSKAFAEYASSPGEPGGRFDYLECRIDTNDNDPSNPGGGSLNGGWQVLFEAYD